MKKIGNQIKKLLKKVNKDPRELKKIMEESIPKLVPTGSEDLKRLSYMFEKIKESFKEKGIETLGEKIRSAKISKQNESLNNTDQNFVNKLGLVMEKEMLIINSLKKILDNGIKLNEMIDPNFMKYIISNYYRTMTEISIRISSEISLNMVREIIKTEKDENKLKKYSGFEKHILEDRLGLDGLKEIFCGYDKRFLQIGVGKMIDEFFLFKEGKGFELRNDITHERLPFKEIDPKKISLEINRVNLFSKAILIIFYIDVFSEFATKEDLDFMNKVFG